jgi:glycosyltransferase involved in cell wall biosynthesis
MKSEEAQIKVPRLEKPVRITEQVWPEGTVPVVSICCITYQHRNFIRDAIEGFLMQETTFPVEIIIHDDASTDGTAEIVREYQEKHPQLFRTILQKENQYSLGKSPGRLTRSMSRGEYIALCEGDDYWIAEEKLQKQVEILDENPDISLVFHNAWAKHAGQSRKDWFFGSNLTTSKNEFSLVDIVDSQHWFIPTCSMVYRRKNSLLIDIYKIAFGGDLVIQLSAALAGRLFYWDEVAGVYRRHSGGIANGIFSNSTWVNEKIKPNFVWVLWFLIRYLKSENDIHITKKRILRTLFEIAEFKISELSKLKTPDPSEIVLFLKRVLEDSRPSIDIESKTGEFVELSDMIQRSCSMAFKKNNSSEIKELSIIGSPVKAIKYLFRNVFKKTTTPKEAISDLLVIMLYTGNRIRHRLFG